MSTQFLHGVETVETEIGGQSVQVVKSGVVALFGIAPSGPVNSLVLCLTETDDAQFGAPLPGFNIPKTLQILRAMAGNFPVMVVNTFNPATNLKQILAEAVTVASGGFLLANSPVGTITINSATGTPTTLALGVDYSVDSYGAVKALTAQMANGTTYQVTYKTLDATTVTPAQLIGTIDGSGNRTGLALYDLAYNTYGYRPKIFAAPTYSSTPAISAAMATAAAKQRAVYLLDAPAGTTVAGAIAGRGIGGTFGFNTSDERALLLYPEIKSYDAAANADTTYPYSAFMAGLIVSTDNKLGYWYSPSNKQLTAATGIERVIQWSLNDAGCEANQLNGAGIITVAAGYGTGMLSWGNRNAAFPTDSTEKNFVSLRRTDDMVSEAMEEAALPYIDKPITQGVIDAMREAGNALLRSLIQRGAVLPGSKVNYNKSDNPASQLATGKIVFERRYMIPTPAEEVVFKDELDISLLSQFN